MPFIKKKFVQCIYKENSGAVTKSKLAQKKRNQKFKKHNRLDFETLVLARTVNKEITPKIWISFKTRASKKAATWRLKQSQSTINYYEK